MTRALTHVALVAFAASLVTTSTLGADAASSGIAFDSVTKMAMGGETAAEPGTFAADFAAASTPANPGNGKRGFMGLGAAIAAASGAMAMFKNGTAERHYVAGAKQRVDTVSSGEARIVDCSARTLTTLDLNKKTYTVVSLDTPEPTAGPASKHSERGAPGPTPTDDGTKVSLAMTTKSLGPRPIDGVTTNGYDAHVKMTTTKPTGETQSFDTDFTSYLSAYIEPRDGCPEANRLVARPAGGPPGGTGAMLMMMRAMKTPKGDPRFTVTSSGQAMPTGRLALWQRTTMGQASGFAMLVERGNVRSIGENDQVFSIPVGFTKTN